MIEFLKELSNTLYLYLEADFLISLFIRSSVILFSAFTIQLILRNYSARVKHRIWYISLITILLIPFFPEQERTYELALYEQETFSTASSIVIQGAETSLQQSKLTPASVNTKEPTRLSLFDRAIVTWLAGVVILVVLLTREIIWLWTIIYRASRLTGKATELVNVCKDQLGLKRKTQVLISSGIKTPLTFGFLYPVILLPEDAENWKEDKLNMVLLHELIHIKRNDYLTNLIGSLSTIICWYSPFSWIALHYQKIECEKACDEKVLANDVDPGQYAMALLRIAERRPATYRNRMQPIISILGASSIKNRILLIMEKNYNKRTLPFSLAAIIGLFIFFEAFSLSSVQFYSTNISEILLPADSRTEELLTYINHPDPAMRFEAAELLKTKRDWRIINPVIDQLDIETDNKVKIGLISSITKYADSRRFYQVASHINSDDRELKIQVLEYMKAISCFPSYLVVEASQYSSDRAVAFSARSLLPAFDERALRKSIKNFAVNFTNNSNLSYGMARKMSQIEGYPVIDSITEILKSNDAEKKKELGKNLLIVASNGEFNKLKEVIKNSE